MDTRLGWRSSISRWTVQCVLTTASWSSRESEFATHCITRQYVGDQAVEAAGFTIVLQDAIYPQHGRTSMRIRSHLPGSYRRRALADISRMRRICGS